MGGYYDAGDNVKFGFPMAFTTTMLSWSVLEFGGLMKGEIVNAKEAIRWGTDYLLKATAHPDTIYVQVFSSSLPFLFLGFLCSFPYFSFIIFAFLLNKDNVDYFERKTCQKFAEFRIITHTLLYTPTGSGSLFPLFLTFQSLGISSVFFVLYFLLAIEEGQCGLFLQVKTHKFATFSLLSLSSTVFFSLVIYGFPVG